MWYRYHHTCWLRYKKMPHIMSFSERMLKSSIQILLTILYYRSYVNAGVRQSNKIHYLSVTSYIHVENSSNQFLITLMTNDILKLLNSYSNDSPWFLILHYHTTCLFFFQTRNLSTGIIWYKLKSSTWQV